MWYEEMAQSAERRAQGKKGYAVSGMRYEGYGRKIKMRPADFSG
jgi:hypothetical protein